MPVNRKLESLFDRVNHMYGGDTIDLVDLDTGATMSVTIDDEGIAHEVDDEVDVVNSPKHYILKEPCAKFPEGLEVYDVRHAILEKLDIEGIVVPNTDIDDWSRAWEYLTRCFFKNGMEDTKKARWYFNQLVDRMEKRQRYVHADS